MASESKQYQIIEEEPVYQGFFNLLRIKLKHTLFRGGWSPVLTRELLRRGDCVAVVLYDPKRDEVVLLEQFRVGALEAEKGEWLLEIVAGFIEPGESAEQVAYREAEEEAGCQIQKLLRGPEFYTSPGVSSERISLFCGIVDAARIGGVHGLSDEGEDILARTVSFAEAMEKVNQGEIESATPLIGLQWLALNRERLRRYGR